MIDMLKKLYAEGNEDLYQELEQMTDDEIMELSDSLANENLAGNYEIINFVQNYLYIRNEH